VRIGMFLRILGIWGLAVCSALAQPAFKEVTMSPTPDQVLVATDPLSQLEGHLAIDRAADGGASSLVVELRNPTQHEVVLRVNADLSAFIMLTATNDHGTVLSKPAKKFNSAETQQFDTVRIGPASSFRWRVPVATWLQAGMIPAHGLKGRLVVNVALLFCRPGGAADPSAQAEYKASVLTLYDMDILLTPPGNRPTGDD